MLGNNNRINFAHLNRPTKDQIHVVLKKSSNNTIVILSKPQTPSSGIPQNSTLSPSPVHFNNNNTLNNNNLTLNIDENKTDKNTLTVLPIKSTIQKNTSKIHHHQKRSSLNVFLTAQLWTGIIDDAQRAE